MALVRGAIFELWFYLSLFAIALAFLPVAAISETAARAAMRLFCIQALWALRVICGLRYEVRGAPPQGPCVVAAKHQSFFEVMILAVALPRPRFVLKKSLTRLPLAALYARQTGAISIDRAEGSAALREILSGMGRERTAQLVIFPQGTRTPPGAGVAAYPYRGGVGMLARASGLDTTPVAVSTGAFWARKAVAKRPGLAVLQFLPVIRAGLASKPYLAALEARIEPAAAALLEQAARNGAID